MLITDNNYPYYNCDHNTNLTDFQLHTWLNVLSDSDFFFTSLSIILTEHQVNCFLSKNASCSCGLTVMNYQLEQV